MGAAVSKEAHPGTPIHQLMNDTLSSTRKPTAQEHAQQSVPGKRAQHTETTSAVKKKPAPSSRANGQLPRPKHVYENLSKAQRTRAGPRSNDTYEIPPMPKKSIKAKNARLPAKLAKGKAALMPGVGVAENLGVDVDKDEPQASQVVVDGSAEHKIEQEAPTRKVTRITPKGAAKRNAQGQQTENNDSFTFTRLAKPDGKQARAQSDGRNLRSRGGDVVLESVDWDRRPEVVAREKRKNASSSAEQRSSQELTASTGLSSTRGNTGNSRDTRNEPNAEPEQIRSDDAHKDQVGTMDHTAGTHDEPAASEGAGQMGSDRDESDETNKDIPTSAQRQNDNDTSPAREPQDFNEDQLPLDEQSDFEPSGSEDVDSEAVDEEQAEAENGDDDQGEAGKSGISVQAGEVGEAVEAGEAINQESGDESDEGSDVESDGSVSSIGVAEGGLFGQAGSLRVIRKALKRVGIQTKKNKMIKHEVELTTKIVKGIVRLTEKAIELRVNLEAVESQASAEFKTLFKKYRCRVREIREDLGLIKQENAGSEKKPMIEEIYAHAIPKLVQLLIVLLRSHGDAEYVESSLLKDDIRAMNIILDLGAKATNWKPRPDPVLTLVSPIGNDVIPPLRTIREAFCREVRRREDEIRREQFRIDGESAERERAIADQLQAEQERLDTERARRSWREAADRAWRSTDPIARYHEKRDQTSSSRASSVNDAVLPQPTPNGTHAWTIDENIALLEGLQRFRGISHS